MLLEPNFFHLHVHSDHGIGMIIIPDLVRRARELGMTSVALTDRWSVAGSVEFYHRCISDGLNPIIGCEVVARIPISGEPADFPLVLLIANDLGRQNLCRLINACAPTGPFGRAPATADILRAHASGLVAFSSCLEETGPRSAEASRQAMQSFGKIYHEFFVELCHHGEPDADEGNRMMERLADEERVRVIVTNNCLYLDETDLPALEVLYRMKGLPLPEGGISKLRGRNFCSFQQLAERFGWQQEPMGGIQNPAGENSSCQFPDDSFVSLELGLEYRHEEIKPQVPRLFAVPGLSPQEERAQRARDGLLDRRGFLRATDPRLAEREQEYRERLEMEIVELTTLGWVEYLLLLSDVRQVAREAGFELGASAGMGNSSLVCFCLGLTDVNPLAFGLFFERLIRKANRPFIDIPVDQARREEFFSFLCQELGGSDHVGHPLNIRRLHRRHGFLKIVETMGLPEHVWNKLQKIDFPNRMEMGQMLDELPELRRLIETEPGLPEAWETYRHLHENIDTTGCSYAFLISDRPLSELAPVRTPEQNWWIYSDGAAKIEMTGPDAESLGLISIGVPGAHGPGNNRRCLDLIRERHGVEIDLDQLPLNDPKTFDLICAGNVEHVEYLHRGDAFGKNLRRAQPSTMAGLAAVFSLYRPFSVYQEVLDDYIASKGQPMPDGPARRIPAVGEILAETRGLWLYPEQMMAVAMAVAGLSAKEADHMLRAIIKINRQNEIPEWRTRLVEGAMVRGIDPADASDLFAEFEEWAEFGYPKSFAYAVALGGYKSAWLKAHYPEEFDATAYKPEG